MMDIDLAIIGMIGQQSSSSGFPNIDMAAWDFNQTTIVDGKISAVADLSGNGYNLSQTDAALRPMAGGIFTGTQYLSVAGMPEINGRKINLIQRVTNWSDGAVYSKSYYGVDTSRISLLRTNTASISMILGESTTVKQLSGIFSGVVEFEVYNTQNKLYINGGLDSTGTNLAITNGSLPAYVGKYANNTTTYAPMFGTANKIVVAFDASESDLTFLREWVNEV